MSYIKQEYYITIERELFSRVNAPYPPDHVIEVDEYEWTKEEEESFRLWLHDYLRTIPGFKKKAKRWYEKEVGWFLLCYSWKYTKEGK